MGRGPAFRSDACERLVVGGNDTLANVLRRKLAERILGGEIEPGARLDEQAIADHYEVSRTPVREALRQLASAGLAEVRPRRGAVVVPLDKAKIGQAFEATAELEALLSGLAAVRGSLVEKGELVALHDEYQHLAERDDPEAFAEANRHFHDKIAELAKNESLVTASRLVRVQTAPFQRAQFQSAEGRRLSLEEHAEILAAICHQDAESAKAAMRKHILRASMTELRGSIDKGTKA